MAPWAAAGRRPGPAPLPVPAVSGQKPKETEDMPDFYIRDERGEIQETWEPGWYGKTYIRDRSGRITGSFE